MTVNVPSTAILMDVTFTIPIFGWKTADLGRANNAVVTADPDLTIPLVAGATYEFWGDIRYTNPSAVGFNFAFAFPGGSSPFVTPGSLAAGVTVATGSVNNGDIGSVVQAPGGTVSATVFTHMTPRGFVTTVGAGNLTFTWCQNASNATATTVGKGSYLAAIRRA